MKSKKNKLLFLFQFCFEIWAASSDLGVSEADLPGLFGLSILCFEAAITRMTLQQLLIQLLEQHAFYEQRSDRKNSQEILTSCLTC